jgi:hypothetical protein
VARLLWWRRLHQANGNYNHTSSGRWRLTADMLCILIGEWGHCGWCQMHLNRWIILSTDGLWS